jgi:hypothetical protein
LTQAPSLSLRLLKKEREEEEEEKKKRTLPTSDDREGARERHKKEKTYFVQLDDAQLPR